jgi:thioredoxin-related protein
MNKEYLAHRYSIFLELAAILFLSVSLSLISSSGRAYAGGQNNAGSIKWESLTAAIKNNKVHKKVFLLHFYFPTCGYCIRMDKHVFSRKSVINYVNKNFHPVLINIYGNKKILYFNGAYLTEKQLAAKFNITGVPAEIFFTPYYRKIFLLPGYWKKSDFMLVSSWVASGKYKIESLRKFSQNYR